MRRLRLRACFMLPICCMILFLSMSPVTAAEETDMQRLSKSMNAFALDMFAQLQKESGNLFFSPYSISTALSMTYAGACGATEQQMAETLHFVLKQQELHPAFADLEGHFTEIQEQGDVSLNIANALWIQESLKLEKAFLKTVEKFYRASVFQKNFVEAYEAVRQEINAWIEEQTSNKITNLLPSGTLSELTRLVLTNAIYFKGDWAIPFEEDATVEAPFWISPDSSTDVEMMHQQTVLKYGEFENGQILVLPYAGDALSMVVVLPQEKDGLNDLQKRLSVEDLSGWLAQAASREVEVYLPKFRITSQFNLSATLQALGMADAFSEKADFSGITAGEQLSISDVVHKAFVEVNEEGTEAAAATAVVVGVTAVMEPQPIPVFQADHPFIFLIQDKQSGNWMFVGRVINPNS